MFGTNSSNRGAFLEATREAREERAAERRRDEAAVKVQAAVRGWLLRCSLHKQIREKFDELLGVEQGSFDQPPSLPPALDVFVEVTRFIKIFRLDKDNKRFEIFTRYLLASMDSENMKLNYVACGMNKELTLQWIQHMKDILIIACKLLESLQAEHTAPQAVSHFYSL
ncbi:ubiquitin-protein ligase E3B-like [Panulirus ornatus]|uniref:ubiquitin-protein ligase E3B-like n=1 Tax=Panulirus ornatus TaxID=150431 RepID=UPI003A87ACDF